MTQIGRIEKSFHGKPFLKTKEARRTNKETLEWNQRKIFNRRLNQVENANFPLHKFT